MSWFFFYLIFSGDSSSWLVIPEVDTSVVGRTIRLSCASSSKVLEKQQQPVNAWRRRNSRYLRENILFGDISGSGLQSILKCLIRCHPSVLRLVKTKKKFIQHFEEFLQEKWRLFVFTETRRVESWVESTPCGNSNVTAGSSVKLVFVSIPTCAMTTPYIWTLSFWAGIWRCIF